MSPYITPLDSYRKEIRILTVHPGTPSTPIQCSSSVASLSDKPDFEALSYVWGDSSTTQHVVFNGVPFHVTSNLAIALRHLRSVDKPRRIWIDALCINQSDTKERNEQVQIMGEIYASAEPVLVWLGEGTDESDQGFDLVSNIVDDVDDDEDVERTIFSFFIDLVKRQWFTRLWTVQEMALARHDPLVGCGTKWVSWSVLLKVWQRIAMSQFKKMNMADQSNRPSGIKLDLLNNIRSAVFDNAGEDLQGLLLDTPSSKASEPRDRIYALRGMLPEKDRMSITVDYNRSVGTVYAEAIAHLFQKGQGPFTLSGLELMGNSPDTSFPSWVPKFGSDGLLRPTLFHPPGVGVSGPGSQCENGVIDEDLKILRVRGMYIDVVVDKLTFGEGNDCIHQLAQAEALVKKARQLAASNVASRPYLDKFKHKEPLWRTLITNKKYSGATREAAPESYEEMFNDLVHRSSSIDEDNESDPAREYKLNLGNHISSNCFFITETGFFGIGPKVVQEGDHLAIWFGAPAPFILRKKERDQDGRQETVYTVHGVAYVAGIMDGEMVDEVYCEDLEDDVTFVVE